MLKISSTLIVLFLSLHIFAQEICDNSIDDDGDGLIDLNDDECDCEGIGGVVESLIPNPSFEDMDCCPSMISQLNCATTWIQASGATSDYFNLCGFTEIAMEGIPPADYALPGGGSGWVGFWSGAYKEYIGACLDGTMLAGTEYTLNFFTAWAQGESTLELSIYGSPLCGDLPWAGSGCPVGMGSWELLGSIDVTYPEPGPWQEVTVTFTPSVDMEAFAIGGPCEGPATMTYAYVDELTLIDSESFSAITQTGSYCDGDLMLAATTDTIGGTWQWYKDGIALEGETDENLEIDPYGLGEFSAVYFVGDECLRANKLVVDLESVSANFEFENVCLGATHEFTNTTTSPGVDSPDWLWSFGDGDTSTDENPTHTYDEAGTYTVTLIANSEAFCNDTISKTVIVSPNPVANFFFVADGVSSNDGSTGGCIINPVQFNDNSTIPEPGIITEWNWNFGDGSTSTLEDPEHTYDAEGTYTVTLIVSTENGCTATYTMDIIMTESITIEIISNEPTCFGFSDGSIIINVTSGGGGDDVIYEIKDADENVLNIDNSNAANSLPAGTYYYSVEDGSACSGFGTITLNQPEELDIEFTTYDPLCYGDKTGSVKVDEVFNATGDYDLISYLWNPNPTDNSGIGADSIWNMGAGEYTITINDENGCDKTFDFIIDQPDSLKIVEFDFEPAYCRLYDYQNGNGVVRVAINGGTPDYDYLWTNLETGETSVSSTWGGLNPGKYEMTATDRNGCTLTKTITVDSLNPKANFEITAPQFTSNYKGTANIEAHFENLSTNFANPNNPDADTTFFWYWDNPNYSDVLNHDLFETFDLIYEAKGQSYNSEICLVAVNKNGCTDTLCKIINVYEPKVLEHVNIFSPNNDGANDIFTFQFTAKSIAEFHCVIVDRWGITKAELNHITDGWDGKNKSGSICADGVYFYTYEAIADDGTQLVGQGTIQLINGSE